VTKTSLTVVGGGSGVTVDARHDRVTAFKYDGAGRLVASTDAVGTIATISHDGLSRVVMTQTGDRVTRNLYDKDNRRVGIVDALGFFTECEYDAGGRLVETVRYSHRSPAAANMSAPAWIGATQQTAVAVRPFRYRVAASDADGDPLVCSSLGAVPPWIFLVLGYDKVGGEWSLMALCYNFTRVLNILGFGRFVAYMVEKARVAGERGLASALRSIWPVLQTFRANIARWLAVMTLRANPAS
jgi:YD repeat-containing protein